MKINKTFENKLIKYIESTLQISAEWDLYHEWDANDTEYLHIYFKDRDHGVKPAVNKIIKYLKKDFVKFGSFVYNTKALIYIPIEQDRIKYIIHSLKDVCEVTSK